MHCALVIVDPGCASSQQCLISMGWAAMHQWSTSFSECFGRHPHFAEWSCRSTYYTAREISDWDEDDIPFAKSLNTSPGDPCVACNGTGLVENPNALNRCPICEGTKVQGEESAEPCLLPLALCNPEWAPGAIVTPDWKWESYFQNKWERQGFSVWERHFLRLWPSIAIVMA